MKTKYLQVLREWNFWGEAQVETGNKRHFYITQLKQLTQLQEVVGVCGVRRSGKTTLLLQLIQELHLKKKVPFKNFLYINFEDPRLGDNISALELFEILKEYQQHFKPKDRYYLFLDEVQVVKNWEKFVRTLYDQQKNVKIFVSGSSSSVFDSSLSTLLSGRIVNLQVLPLNFPEFIQFKKIDPNSLNSEEFYRYLDEYLTYGGFPRVVLEDNKTFKQKLLISYYESILEQDVILKNNIKKATALKQLAKYVLSNVGNQISTYALEKTFGISNQNINRYLNYLADAYLIFRVPKFAYSVKQQIYNPDKVFSVDFGLINTAGFAFSENKGRFLENLVYLSLKQYHKDIFYWKNGTEVDLVIKKGIKIEKLINVTTTVDDDQVWNREINSLNIAKKEHPQAQLQIITLHNQSNRDSDELIDMQKFLLKSD